MTGKTSKKTNSATPENWTEGKPAGKLIVLVHGMKALGIASLLTYNSNTLYKFQNNCFFNAQWSWLSLSENYYSLSDTVEGVISGRYNCLCIFLTRQNYCSSKCDVSVHHCSDFFVLVGDGLFLLITDWRKVSVFYFS